jgi:hypothetical protein
MADSTWYGAGTDFGLQGGDAEAPNSMNEAFSLGNLASLYNPSDFGYSGNIFNTEGTGQDQSQYLNPDFQRYLTSNGYSLQGNTSNNQNSLLSGLFKNGRQINQKALSFNDPIFGGIIDAGLGAVTGGFGIPGAGFGTGLGLTGAQAAAASGALAGGMSSAGNGGNFFQGALSGGLGGGLSGLNLANSAGITNPILNTAANSAIGGTASGLAQGRSLSDSLQSGGVQGLTSGFTQSMNQLGRTFLPDIMGSIFGPSSTNSDSSLPMLSNNASQNASFPTGTQSLYEQLTGAPQDNSAQMASYAPDNPPLMNQVLGTQRFNDTAPSAPNMKIQSLSDLASNPSLANAGKFVGNNAGDLASMLYGMYNMNRQKKQMSQMMGGLQGLYSPDGAYATQLRNTLKAKDAASGRRSNYAGRETQLMAELANRNSSLMPAMMQMQNGQNSLGNNQMNLFLQGMNKLGGWDGLKTLFNGNSGGG